MFRSLFYHRMHHLFFGLGAMVLVIFMLFIPKQCDHLHDTIQAQSELPTSLPTSSAQEPTAAPVNIGLTIIDIVQCDEPHNKYTFDVLLTITFDPHVVDRTIGDKIFFDSCKIRNKRLIKEQQRDNHTYVLQYRMDVTCFSCNVESILPVDQHYIQLNVVYDQFAPCKITLHSEPSGCTVHDFAQSRLWRIIDQRVRSDSLCVQLDRSDPRTMWYRACAQFTFIFTKVNTRNMLIMLLPLLLIFLISAFSAIIAGDRHSRIARTMAYGALTALISYRYVIGIACQTFFMSDFAQNLYVFILCISFINVMIVYIAKYAHAMHKAYPWQCVWFYTSIMLLLFFVHYAS